MEAVRHRRLHVLRSQLLGSFSRHAPHALAAGSTSSAPLRLEAVSGSLSSQDVPFNYFDWDRFRADHGTEAKPIREQRPRTIRAEAEKADPQKEATVRAQRIEHYKIPLMRPVMDARDAPAESIVLDEHGFKLYNFPTSMPPADFYDRELVETRYLPECEELIKKATGATKVLPFDYVVRNQARRAAKEAAGYSPQDPHNDHTLVSGPRRTRELLGEDPVNGECLKHRFAIMNVWRRWDGGNANPLACCAYPSLDYARDMIGADLIYPHRTGEDYTVRGNEDHKFYWFRNMTIDEALILKIYDSREDVARGSLHTSFPNSLASPTDPVRESMEVRCIVLFGPDDLTEKATLRGGAPATNVQGYKEGVAGGGHNVQGLIDHRSTPKN